jgi:phospholipid transport system substrate-binding protein
VAASCTKPLAVCALSLALPAWPAGASAQSAPVATPDPVATIRSFDRRLRSVLRRRVPSWSPEADLAQLQIHELVDDTLSISELARETLGDHWNAATQEQKRAFLSLFRELLAKRIASGQLLDYEPESTPRLILRVDGVADVGMVVRTRDSGADEARRAEVDYKLRYLAGRWRLVDLVVDEQSVVSAYRYQFDRIIAREHMEGLLERMRRKIG